MTLWEFLLSQGVNEVPGMGSQANAGGFTSGQMRDRSEDMLAKDYFGFVPGHAPMPQGMAGTPGGPAPQRGMNTVPGMGSTANAMSAPPNPYSTQAQGATDAAEKFRLLQMLGGGLGVAGIATGNVPAAMTGAGGMYVSRNLAEDYERRAKANRYQGN